MIGFGGGIPTSEIVDDIEQDSEVQLFPQPCSNEFEIVSSKEIRRVDVYSIQGELLFSQTVNSNRAFVQLSNYPSSLYFVRLFCADGSESVKKVLKQ